MNPLYTIVSYSGISKFLRHINANQTLILCLHRVSDDSCEIWPALKPIVFEDLLKFVIKNFNVISFEDLLNWGVKGKKANLILTFDDGYKDFIEVAMPIMDKYRVPSNQNIIIECLDTKMPPWSILLIEYVKYCARVGKKVIIIDEDNSKSEFEIRSNRIYEDYDRLYRYILGIDYRVTRAALLDQILHFLPEYNLIPMMSEQDVKEVHRGGVTIGSHSYTHPLLGNIFEKKEALWELVQSKKRLEDLLGSSIELISYPMGSYNAETLKLSIKAGYKTALLTGEKSFEFKGKQSGLNVLPRVSIYHNNHLINKLRLSGIR